MSGLADENAARVQWAHVLDESGSADLYDTEAEARSMLDLCGGGLDRIESTTVVPYSRSVPPAAQQRAADGGGEGALRERVAALADEHETRARQVREIQRSTQGWAVAENLDRTARDLRAILDVERIARGES